jgi:UDP-GlcNAc:undecaprenyl-phosphate GlcNAc-1-phosphate transferase
VKIAWVMYALVAFVATLSVTELVRVFALRLRAVDQPGGRRVHLAPTARLGGLGIFWGFAISLGLATYGGPLWRAPLAGADPALLGLVLGAGLMLVVGMLDDIYGLAAPRKLGLQIGAALLLYAFGWRVETLGLPGVGSWPVGLLSLPLTVAWVVFATNALNLIDGLDGLATGVALVAAIAAGLLLGNDGGAARLAAAGLAGALAGFLWFNLNPALIFMGDAGSLFVGFVLSAITLRAGQVASPEAFPLVPMLLLAVPLLDTLAAIRRRTVAAARASRPGLGFLREAARRVFAPDGQHVHHRLVGSGVSTRRAVALLWGMAAWFALGGFLLPHSTVAGAALVAGCGMMSWRGLGVIRARRAGESARPPVVLAGGGEGAAAGGAGEPEREAA